MKSSVAGFVWDGGNWPKCGKHGVTKEEIKEIFQTSPVVMPGPHPDEPRMCAIGKTRAGRYMFLVFAFCLIDGQTFIRPVSARHMRQREVAHHEKTYASGDAVVAKR